MNVVSISKRFAATGAVTALAAGALVGLGTTSAQAATVTNTYTCSIPQTYSGDFPMTVTGELPVPQYYAGAPVPAGLLNITAKAQVPDDAAQLLAAFNYDGARSGDFGFTFGDGSVGAPLSGSFAQEDGHTVWNATGSNTAFTTPAPGHYDAVMPDTFTITATNQGADGAQLTCLLAVGQTAQTVTSIDLVKQTSTTAVDPKVIKVKKGKMAKVPAAFSTNAGGTPSKKLVAKEGSKTLGTAAIKNGQAVIKLGKKLKPGKHKVVVSYPGDTNINGSSDKVTVKVVK